MLLYDVLNCVSLIVWVLNSKTKTQKQKQKKNVHVVWVYAESHIKFLGGDLMYISDDENSNYNLTS